MSKRLELLFSNEAGRNVTISIDDPLEPVDSANVSKVMDDVILFNAFTTHEGSLVAKRGARIVERTVQDIEITSL
ncbi:DUF2922 domain-containing protein [Evansella cellulosilytica]|uniref:DUF2922 domain-containing protein n=1 Tax=Evansella cellulosilytica (strain ATCC 21833 / DSM 2522 / FERM P-1141 / JCM 9156 / N-4) TaxID=649639 RepID=E6TY23_EVAC2|nr:DUF2922 domain-containing protein [Evansella cellulosilytica]ADU31236.1 hypothetical protein Bcell_2986 [Evansella cellulosilytica DSM 2522]